MPKQSCFNETGARRPRIHAGRVGADYACGEAARGALVALIDDREVSCEGRRRGYYGRTLGVCWAGDSEINRRLVADGWAVIDPRYPSAYHDEQDAAEAAERGLWAGAFELPWEWRRARR